MNTRTSDPSAVRAGRSARTAASTPPAVTPPAPVAVIGLGYIGLPTAAVLATHGLDVVGVDVRPSAVAAVNLARPAMAEPGLAAVMARAARAGTLRAQLDTPAAQTYIIAVPTPLLQDRTADLTHVEAAVRNIAPRLRGGELIILESTSPPGTTRSLAETVINLRPDLSLDGSGGRPAVLFAHCPERVLPGRIMTELITNDRIVGGLTPAAADAAAALYRTFCRGRIHLTDAATAEMAKLAENAYRDVNIAFANELAAIAERVGIDPWQLIDLANHHPRVDILQPGPGVGGHCIAVDPWFLVSADPDRSRLIATAREVNDARPAAVVGSVVQAVADLERPTIAALGLAFKANVEDLRESPAVTVVLGLAAALPGAQILVASPHAAALPPELEALANVRLAPAEAAVDAAEAVVLLVDDDAFRSITPARLAGKRLVDTRGFWRARP